MEDITINEVIAQAGIRSYDLYSHSTKIKFQHATTQLLNCYLEGIDIRFKNQVLPVFLPPQPNEDIRDVDSIPVSGNSFNVTYRQVERMLFVLIILDNAREARETIKWRTFMYKYQRLLGYSGTGSAYNSLNSVMANLSRMLGIPRTTLGFTYDDTVYIRGKMTAKIGGQEIDLSAGYYLDSLGHEMVVESLWRSNIVQEERKVSFGNFGSICCMMIVEKPEIADSLYNSMGEVDCAKVVFIATKGMRTISLLNVKKLISLWAKVHGVDLENNTLWKGDSDMPALRIGFSFQHDESDQLSTTEKCLLAPIKLVGPSPQDDAHIFEAAGRTRKFGLAISNNDRKELMRWLDPYKSSILVDCGSDEERRNRIRHLVGFQTRKTNLRYEDYPQELNQMILTDMRRHFT